jgi:RNA polymerase sigma-70 factor (ECF subfamily)
MGERTTDSSMEEHRAALLDRALHGDQQALAELFEEHRNRLKRMITLRMDARLRARLDASDVVQEAYVQLARRIADYGKRNELPFFLWLRLIAGDQLAQLHRMHLGTAKRDAGRELAQGRTEMPQVSTFCLAEHLAGQYTSVDRNLLRAEAEQRLRIALDSLDASDREILAMRNFEELSTEEIGLSLGLTRSGVLKRYTRAVRRLREAFVRLTDTGRPS